MKKRSLIIILSCLANIGVWGQNQRNNNVAIAEVVDKEDKVSYPIELMVRSALTETITNKQGYIAFDRVDIQSVLEEHDFQRTGLVSEKSIRKLGEMTGANLLLIAEAAHYDDNNIYVTAKIIDIETLETKIVKSQMMESTTTGISKGCQNLSNMILGIDDPVKNNEGTAIASDEVITLFGYLHVFPTDIGEFQKVPEAIINSINKEKTYGYDSWRLPNAEELSLMRSNSRRLSNFRNVSYMTSDATGAGVVRLVSTDKTVLEKSAIRKKAILNLLGLTDIECVIDEETNLVICSTILEDNFYHGRYTTDWERGWISYEISINDNYDKRFRLPTVDEISRLHKYIDLSKKYILDFHCDNDDEVINEYFMAYELYNYIYYKGQKIRYNFGREGTNFGRDRDRMPAVYVNDTKYAILLVQTLPDETAIQQEIMRISQ